MRKVFQLSILLLVTSVALFGCAKSEPDAPAPSGEALYDPGALPPGALGDEIRLGHDIVVNTQTRMKGYVRAQMSCSACHIDAGMRPRAGSFIGTYAEFPQWNKRAHRVIALQDRLIECFLYSMNGRPPAYSSKEMIGMVAYIAWLSRKTPVFSMRDDVEHFVMTMPSGTPNLSHGATLYAQKCASCHQASGAGVPGTFPPLWGAASFNDRAGLSHVERMTVFVRYNMPQDAPGSLSLRDAYDVSAFVLSHTRPAFQRNRMIAFPAQPAKFF